MKFLKAIRNIFLIVLLFGLITTYYDYTNLKKGNSPLFCLRNYNEKTKTEKLRGIFYIVERKVKENPSERFNLSDKITYHILWLQEEIVLERPKDTYDFILEIADNPTCESSKDLYVETKDYKIYLDCITSIKEKKKDEKTGTELKEILEKNPKEIDKIIENLSYMGKTAEETGEIFRATNDLWMNKKLSLYKCENQEIILTTKEGENDYCK